MDNLSRLGSRAIEHPSCMTVENGMTVHWISDRWLLILAVLIVCATSAGCRGTTPVFKDVPVQADPVEAGSHDDKYLRNAGDRVAVVSDSGELESSRIQEDGTLTLPSRDTTFAAGKMIEELRTELEAKYPQLRRRHRHDDLIYYVTGEDKSPGPKLYVRGLRVSQAIQAAGGFTERAKSNQVQLVRADRKKFR
jgi:protein involved in polysaccharide export with SLBB domain